MFDSNNPFNENNNEPENKEQEFGRDPDTGDYRYGRGGGPDPVNQTPDDFSKPEEPSSYSAYANQNQAPEKNPFTNPKVDSAPVDSVPIDGLYENGQTFDFSEKKEKKPKSHFSLGVFIASCLICALLGGGVSTGLMAIAFNYPSKGNSSSSGDSSNKSGSNVTNINVDKTTSDLVAAVAEKASPSVVGIRATAAVNNYFFGEQTSSGEGSGIIFRAEGYIITNYHVIQIVAESNSAGATIQVFLPDDPKTGIPATIIGYDAASDLAVIKIDKTGLPAIEVGSSADLKVGEVAVAIGNPGGLEFMGSVSSGVISGLNRSITLENTATMTLIQTDAAINPGNSGGALVNSSGKLIGINSAKMASSQFEGMGFAIPVDYAVKVCNNIITHKDDKKPYIGIQVSTSYNEATLKQMGYPAGAVVETVVADSPAEEGGLRRGDIITAVDGTAVKDYNEFNTERLKHKPGETIKLTVYRSNKTSTISITLGESNS